MGTDIAGTAEELGRTILWPMQTLMQAAGLTPTDMQVWALMVAIFMIGLMAPTTYGSLVLNGRQRRARGTVVAIEEGDDAPSTPRISFRDERGVSHEFASSLPCNGRTGTIGNAVDVIYDPFNPALAREAGRWVTKGLIAFAWYGGAIALIVYATMTDGFQTG